MFQFPFQRALVVDLLVELRSHPVGLVEDLKAQPPALHAALGRGRQARLVQLRGRHQDAASVGSRLKGNLRLRESLAGLTRIIRVQIRIKDAPVSPQTVPEQASNQRRQQQSSRQHPATLRRLHPGPADPRQAPQSGQPVAQLGLSGHRGRALLQLCSVGHGLRVLSLWVISDPRSVLGHSQHQKCLTANAHVSLELHSDHLLVSLNSLVADRQRQFKGHVRFLGGNHRLMHIHAGAGHQP